MNNSDLAQEWTVLQNQYDSYEKHSLLIKLLSIVYVGISASFGELSLLTAVLCLVFWLQDAIWKTFQSRIEPRLLRIETQVADDQQAAPFQFNTEYQQTSAGALGKIREYALQAIKPTVAFPYVAIVFITLITLV